MTIGKNIVIAAYAITFVAAIAVLVPAFAGETSQLPHVAVRYDDLNLSHHAGAQVLVRRLQQAARQVCGEEHFLSGLRGQALYRTCVRESLDRAVAAVGQPIVSEIYLGRPGQNLSLAGN